ncbi:MAG: TonB-dependent receptor [Acidobacteriia bacterium]|nr:TonB-dependent receptor [Terriglobia bacterium]
MRCLRSVVVLSLCIFCLGASAYAQDASLIGTITDDTKAVLPGATVTAVNLETGVQTVAISDARGEYRMRLQPGPYKVQAELSGFAPVVLARVELLVGQNATVPMTLKVAQINEALTVTAESPLVDVSSSQVAGNVDRRQMEDLPLQGRNWMELSKMVKGITANDVNSNRPGVDTDDMFQLNLDGQQVTQKTAGSGFGQPKFSREAIAEFQIVTTMFDITQGRSAGIEVQAISKSGTNRNSGSTYGYFRDDRLNAADPISGVVLPYSNQQLGGTFGGPVIKDKLHYFGSYEYEREPGTLVTSPTPLPGQTFSNSFKTAQQSLLGRVDDQINANNRLTVRLSRWTWNNPFILGAGGHPSNASIQDKLSRDLLGTWSTVMKNGGMIQEVKAGYASFNWTNLPQPSMVGVPEYDFPGLTIGAPYNYPQYHTGGTWSGRYDLSWHKDKHDLKVGAEYLHVHDTGDWYIQAAGRYTMSSVPANLNQLVPASAALDPTKWNLAGLSPLVLRFDQNFARNGFTNLFDTLRPMYAVWIGDNWRASERLTLNLGLRWDADPSMAAPPGVTASSIPINNGVESGDFGYKTEIRDWRDFAPRAGFTYNVGGKNDLVIRGGSGVYYASPVSNVTYSPKVYSNLITGTFANDGRANFISNPTNGVTGDQLFAGTAKAPVQSPRVIVGDFKSPYTWQSSIGFQKQINSVTGIDVDLTHFNEYRDTRTYDPNLFYDPVTGYNKNPSTGRPNPAYGQVLTFISNGHRDQTQLATGVTRRLQNKLQAGVTYTLMFSMHDDGGIGYTSPGANNPFNYVDGEYATSNAFQRNTVRTYAMYQLPYGFSTSVTYFYGSGNLYSASISATPYGKTGTNRLNLTNAGGTAATITIPAGVADRFDGPATITSGTVIPRNALEGLPLHKVDFRITKDIKLGGTARATLIAEVFNVFNHANYGSYATTLSATNAATTALFGQPQQTDGNAYVPREAQLGFRIGF